MNIDPTSNNSYGKRSREEVSPTLQNPLTSLFSTINSSPKPQEELPPLPPVKKQKLGDPNTFDIGELIGDDTNYDVDDVNLDMWSTGWNPLREIVEKATLANSAEDWQQILAALSYAFQDNPEMDINYSPAPGISLLTLAIEAVNVGINNDAGYKKVRNVINYILENFPQVDLGFKDQKGQNTVQNLLNYLCLEQIQFLVKNKRIPTELIPKDFLAKVEYIIDELRMDARLEGCVENIEKTFFDDSQHELKGIEFDWEDWGFSSFFLSHYPNLVSTILPLEIYYINNENYDALSHPKCRPLEEIFKDIQGTEEEAALVRMELDRSAEFLTLILHSLSDINHLEGISRSFLSKIDFHGAEEDELCSLIDVIASKHAYIRINGRNSNDETFLYSLLKDGYFKAALDFLTRFPQADPTLIPMNFPLNIYRQDVPPNPLSPLGLVLKNCEDQRLMEDLITRIVHSTYFVLNKEIPEKELEEILNTTWQTTTSLTLLYLAGINIKKYFPPSGHQIFDDLDRIFANISLLVEQNNESQKLPEEILDLIIMQFGPFKIDYPITRDEINRCIERKLLLRREERYKKSLHLIATNGFYKFSLNHGRPAKSEFQKKEMITMIKAVLHRQLKGKIPTQNLRKTLIKSIGKKQDAKKPVLSKSILKAAIQESLVIEQIESSLEKKMLEDLA